MDYGYPGYNFMQGYGGLPPVNPGAQSAPTYSQTPLLGQGMMQGGIGPTDPGHQQQHGHHGGMSPLMALSPLLGMFMSGHPNMGLGMISPALGIGSALGMFK